MIEVKAELRAVGQDARQHYVTVKDHESLINDQAIFQQYAVKSEIAAKEADVGVEEGVKFTTKRSAADIYLAAAQSKEAIAHTATADIYHTVRIGEEEIVY